MSRDEKDYSDLIQHLSNLGNALSLMSGFVFTSITVLITQHPDPSKLMAQITLLFLAIMLDVFMLQITRLFQSVIYYCRNLPPPSKKVGPWNWLMDTSVSLGLGSSTVLLFLTWNLVYLALAQSIAVVLTIAVTYVLVLKPFYEWNAERLKKLHSRSED